MTFNRERLSKAGPDGAVRVKPWRGLVHAFEWRGQAVVVVFPRRATRVTVYVNKAVVAVGQCAREKAIRFTPHGRPGDKLYVSCGIPDFLVRGYVVEVRP